MEKILVISVADNNYVIPLTVTLYSLLSHLKPKQPIVLYVMDGGIKSYNKIKVESSLKRLNRPFELIWLDVSRFESKIDNLKLSGHFTKAIYYRLLIPDLLDNDIKKIIYLDSDLLIQEDLEELWNVELQDQYLWAVQDIGIPYVSSPNGLTKYREWGLNENDKYFNAGVLLINLERWRKDNISQQVIDFIQVNRNSIRWLDQDGLNAILAGKWGQLDPRWNQVAKIHRYSSWQESPFSEAVYYNVLKHPKIIHFTSQIKPWNFKVTYKCPYEDLFFEYLDQTAWKGWRPKEALKTRLKRYWRKITNLFN